MNLYFANHVFDKSWFDQTGSIERTVVGHPQSSNLARTPLKYAGVFLRSATKNLATLVLETTKSQGGSPSSIGEAGFAPHFTPSHPHGAIHVLLSSGCL
jgi:hypothetical protein